MHFSNRHASEDDQLPKVLFYSVLLHYALVYLFFGNPFLILNRDDGSTGSAQSFEVKLISLPINLPMNGGDANKALVAGALRREDFNQGAKTAIPTTRIPGEKQVENLEEEKVPVLNPETEDDAADQSKALQPPRLVRTNKVRLKMPPNMTGPEDCMLKVVGMVCPQGKVGCITAYREFCASLEK